MSTIKMELNSTTPQKISVYLILILSILSFITLSFVAKRTPKTAPNLLPKESQPVKEIEMKITFYCKNECCCGEWADGTTASGDKAEGLIVAADTDYYPFGTKMTIDGVTYTVKDRGGAIKGPYRLDMLCKTHAEALDRGVIYKTVKIARKDQWTKNVRF